MRVVAPAYVVLAIVSAFDPAPSTVATASALAASAIASLLASGSDVAIAAANATAYGDEQRLPLRVPPALFLAPVPLARVVVAAGVTAGPLLLADGRVVAGTVAVVTGFPLAAFCARALHNLSRRWAVLVPAGLAVVDPMTLADPVLLPRGHITGLQAVGAEHAPDGVLDLRLGASSGSLAVRFDEPAELVLAGRGRRPPETVRTSEVRLAVVRRDALLRGATARRIPIR